MEEVYVETPRTKPVKAFKARVKVYDNDVVVVNPQEPRESNRKMIKQKGKSSFYKSEGEKESSYSLHLNVDAKDCADPVGALFEQFLTLTKEQQKKPPQFPENQQGRMLFDDNNSLQVWLDAEKHEVVIQTRLQCSPQIERQLLQAQAQMNVTLGRHRQEIINNSK